jgi:hypothetical protein
MVVLVLFYKYVNCKLNGSNGIAPLKDVDGNLVITDWQSQFTEYIFLQCI